MARKTSTTPTKIWSFGCRRPNEDDETVVFDQLRRAQRYYNRLIEIERKRREDYRALRTSLFPVIEQLENRDADLTVEIELVRTAIKANRQASRKKTPVDPETRERLQRLQTERREVRAGLREQRALAQQSEEMKTRSEAVQEASYAAIRAARADEDTPYWGTYLLVEEAAKAAAKAKVDPRFRGFRGEGRIGVQVQGGLSTEDLFSGRSTLLQVDPLPEGQWDTRSGRRHAKTVCRIRVGSNGRAPVWVHFPVLIHRKLPAGTIKAAWIAVTKCGAQTRYALQIVIEAESFKHRAHGTGTVALDLGWRQMGEGLRVAYWADDKGRHGSLELPTRLYSGLTLPNALRSYGDLHFEQAKGALKAWLGDHEVPEWVREATSHLAQWRSPQRLARVAFRLVREGMSEDDITRLWKVWKNEKLSRREDLFDTLEAITAWASVQGIEEPLPLYLEWWRRKNRHLLTWESQQRRGALARRRQLYAEWANWLAETYDKVILEDFDLRKVAELPNTEEEDPMHARARRNRMLASVSDLRLAIKERVEPERVVLKPAAYTTATCSACGNVDEGLDLYELYRRCSACLDYRDQDYNAALNLLGGERSSGVHTPRTSRTRVNRGGSRPERVTQAAE